MCPACFSAAVLAIAGATSSSGVAALFATRFGRWPRDTRGARGVVAFNARARKLPSGRRTTSSSNRNIIANRG
jgi:hypothetical protein